MMPIKSPLRLLIGALLGLVITIVLLQSNLFRNPSNLKGCIAGTPGCTSTCNQNGVCDSTEECTSGCSDCAGQGCGTGGSCNQNGICEAGETNDSCHVDCPLAACCASNSCGEATSSACAARGGQFFATQDCAMVIPSNPGVCGATIPPPDQSVYCCDHLQHAPPTCMQQSAPSLCLGQPVFDTLGACTAACGLTFSFSSSTRTCPTGVPLCAGLCLQDGASCPSGPVSCCMNDASVTALPAGCCSNNCAGGKCAPVACAFDQITCTGGPVHCCKVGQYCTYDARGCANYVTSSSASPVVSCTVNAINGQCPQGSYLGGGSCYVKEGTKCTAIDPTACGSGVCAAGACIEDVTCSVASSSSSSSLRSSSSSSSHYTKEECDVLRATLLRNYTAATSALDAKYAVLFANLLRDYNTSIAILDRDLPIARTALYDRYKAKVAALQVEYTSALAALRNTYNTAISSLGDFATWKANLYKNYLASAAALEKEYQAALAALKPPYDDALVAMDSKNAATLAKLDSDFVASRDALDSQYAAALVSLYEKYSASRDSFNAQYNAEFAVLTANYLAAIDASGGNSYDLSQLRWNYNGDVKRLKTKYDTLLADLERGYSVSRKTLGTQYASQSASLSANYNKLVTQLKTLYATIRSQLESKNIVSSKEITKTYEAKGAQLDSEYQTSLRNGKKTYDETLARIQNEHSSSYSALYKKYHGYYAYSSDRGQYWVNSVFDDARIEWQTALSSLNREYKISLVRAKNEYALSYDALRSSYTATRSVLDRDYNTALAELNLQCIPEPSSSSVSSSAPSSFSSSLTSSLSSSRPQVCELDVQKCPDGSYVARTGPNCSFTSCQPVSSGSSSSSQEDGYFCDGVFQALPCPSSSSPSSSVNSSASSESGDCSEKLAALDRNYATAITALDAKYNASRDDATTAYETSGNSLLAKYDADRNALLSAHTAARNALETKNTASLNALLGTYTTSRNTLETNYIDAINAAYQTYSTSTASSRLTIYQNTLATLKNSYLASSATLEKSYQSSRSIITRDYTAARDTLDRTYAASNDALYRTFTAARAALDRDYAASRTSLYNTYLANLDALHRNYSTSRNSLNRDCTDLPSSSSSANSSNSSRLSSSSKSSSCLDLVCDPIQGCSFPSIVMDANRCVVSCGPMVCSSASSLSSSIAGCGDAEPVCSGDSYPYCCGNGSWMCFDPSVNGIIISGAPGGGSTLGGNLLFGGGKVSSSDQSGSGLLQWIVDLGKSVLHFVGTIFNGPGDTLKGDLTGGALLPQRSCVQVVDSMSVYVTSRKAIDSAYRSSIYQLYALYHRESYADRVPRVFISAEVDAILAVLDGKYASDTAALSNNLFSALAVFPLNCPTESTVFPNTCGVSAVDITRVYVDKSKVINSAYNSSIYQLYSLVGRASYASRTPRIFVSAELDAALAAVDSKYAADKDALSRDFGAAIAALPGDCPVPPPPTECVPIVNLVSDYDAVTKALSSAYNTAINNVYAIYGVQNRNNPRYFLSAEVKASLDAMDRKYAADKAASSRDFLVAIAAFPTNCPVESYTFTNSCVSVVAMTQEYASATKTLLIAYNDKMNAIYLIYGVQGRNNPEYFLSAEVKAALSALTTRYAADTAALNRDFRAAVAAFPSSCSSSSSSRSRSSSVSSLRSSSSQRSSFSSSSSSSAESSVSSSAEAGFCSDATKPQCQNTLFCCPDGSWSCQDITLQCPGACSGGGSSNSSVFSTSSVRSSLSSSRSGSSGSSRSTSSLSSVVSSRSQSSMSSSSAGCPSDSSCVYFFDCLPENTGETCSNLEVCCQNTSSSVSSSRSGSESSGSSRSDSSGSSRSTSSLSSVVSSRSQSSMSSSSAGCPSDSSCVYFFDCAPEQTVGECSSLEVCCQNTSSTSSVSSASSGSDNSSSLASSDFSIGSSDSSLASSLSSSVTSSSCPSDSSCVYFFECTPENTGDACSDTEVCCTGVESSASSLSESASSESSISSSEESLCEEGSSCVYFFECTPESTLGVCSETGVCCQNASSLSSSSSSFIDVVECQGTAPECTGDSYAYCCGDGSWMCWDPAVNGTAFDSGDTSFLQGSLLQSNNQGVSGTNLAGSSVWNWMTGMVQSITDGIFGSGTGGSSILTGDLTSSCRSIAPIGCTLESAHQVAFVSMDGPDHACDQYGTRYLLSPFRADGTCTPPTNPDYMSFARNNTSDADRTQMMNLIRSAASGSQPICSDTAVTFPNDVSWGTAPVSCGPDCARFVSLGRRGFVYTCKSPEIACRHVDPFVCTSMSTLPTRTKLGVRFASMDGPNHVCTYGNNRYSLVPLQIDGTCPTDLVSSTDPYYHFTYLQYHGFTYPDFYTFRATDTSDLDRQEYIDLIKRTASPQEPLCDDTVVTFPNNISWGTTPVSCGPGCVRFVDLSPYQVTTCISASTFAPIVPASSSSFSSSSSSSSSSSFSTSVSSSLSSSLTSSASSNSSVSSLSPTCSIIDQPACNDKTICCPDGSWQCWDSTVSCPAVCGTQSSSSSSVPDSLCPEGSACVNFYECTPESTVDVCSDTGVCCQGAVASSSSSTAVFSSSSSSSTSRDLACPTGSSCVPFQECPYSQTLGSCSESEVCCQDLKEGSSSSSLFFPTFPPNSSQNYEQTFSSENQYPASNLAYCGDGIQQAGEKCDDGGLNGQVDQNCTTTCQILTVVTCGNGAIDSGEECDDSNALDGDGCSAQCKVENGTCGDGQISSGFGEQCDDGAQNGQPSSDCTVLCRIMRTPECGNGVVDSPLEQCDRGISNGNYASTRCLDNCQLPYCGDGIVAVNEECDAGDTFDGDGCDHTCRRAVHAASPVVGSLVPQQGIRSSADDYDQVTKVPTPARTGTGPGMVIFVITGAAAGVGLARRRFLRRS